MAPRWCLGLGGSNHDFATSLTRDDEIVVAIEEERVSRMKYSIGANSLFPLGRKYCLGAAGISMEDVDAIVADDTLMPSAYFALRDRTEIIRHHLAHIASAFYPSPFERAAVLVIDGAGSYISEENAVETATFAVAEGTSLQEIGKVLGKNWRTDELSTRRIYQFGDSDDSLGFMYKAVSRAIGFVFYTDGSWFLTEDGKTMGLAPYGSSRYHDEFRRYLELLPDGQFRLHLREGGLIEFVDDIAASVKNKVESARFRTYADLASAAQTVLEETMSHMFGHLARATGAKSICLAGGVALNCVANGAVFAKSDFDEIFIQPAAGDAGNAIGCALYGYHNLLGGERRRRGGAGWMRHAYLGRSHSAEEIESAVAAAGLPSERIDDPAEVGAQLLSEGKLIGWFQGESEFGPRALGHRSILADPRGAETKDVLNARVKHRESFRPFAPAVLEQQASEYFELGVASPYMLLVAPVREEKRSVVPAIVHVDGSARVQTLTREANGIFFDLVAAFFARTGVPVVLNTSFNDRGQPIVESPDDAVAFFARSGLDFMIIESLLVGLDATEVTRVARL